MPTTSDPAAEPVAKSKGVTGNSQTWRMAGIVLVVLSSLLALTWRTPGKRPPSEIQGKWQTTNAAYSHRVLEIDRVCISFTTGEGTISVGFIQDIKRISAGDATLYTVSYTLDGVPNVVSFYFNPSNGGSLWFKNQKNVVWKKTAES